MNTESDSSPDFSNEAAPATPADMGAPSVRPLRYWPALLLVALIWVSKVIPLVLPGSFAGFIISMLAPLVAALLIIVWWAFFSRATRKEKIAGVVGLVAAGVIANALCHPSVQGFGMVLGGLPWGVTWFVIASTLLSVARPGWRTGMALLAAAAPLFYQCLFRVDGIAADMAANRLWRWQP
ncbi:MAG: hypothetical protein EHM42_06495, partial [Planctomycetaceae bacterium]